MESSYLSSLSLACKVDIMKRSLQSCREEHGLCTRYRAPGSQGKNELLLLGLNCEQLGMGVWQGQLPGSGTEERGPCTCQAESWGEAEQT